MNVMNSPAVDRFARWVAQAKAYRRGKPLDSPAFSITLSPEFGNETAQLGEDLIAYLNEFDENGAGHWEVFDHEALQVINKNNGYESLPTWGKHAPGLLPRVTPHGGYKPLLNGIARLGNVVLVEDHAYLTTQEIQRVFHVRLTHLDTEVLEADTRPFHLVLNRTRFGPDSLVNIIGDSALEWASRGHDPADRILKFESL